MKVTQFVLVILHHNQIKQSLITRTFQFLILLRNVTSLFSFSHCHFKKVYYFLIRITLRCIAPSRPFLFC